MNNIAGLAQFIYYAYYGNGRLISHNDETVTKIVEYLREPGNEKKNISELIKGWKQKMVAVESDLVK